MEFCPNIFIYIILMRRRILNSTWDCWRGVRQAPRAKYKEETWRVEFQQFTRIWIIYINWRPLKEKYLRSEKQILKYVHVKELGVGVVVPGVVRLDLPEMVRPTDRDEPLNADPHQQVDADTERNPETEHSPPEAVTTTVVREGFKNISFLY